MRLARFSGIPGRKAGAAVLDDMFPMYIFIPLFIIFAAACLLMSSCTDEDIIGPGNGPNDPVCGDSLPSVEILSPSANTATFYPTTFSFTVSIESHTAAAGMRHLLVEVIPGVPGEPDIAMLNEHPEAFEDLWSEWEIPKNGYVWIDIGEDEPLLAFHHYLFAVQVMDSCGRVDSLFTHEKNARQFITKIRYPELTVMGKMLGSSLFRRTDLRPAPILVPPGVPLAFKWCAPRSFEWMPMEYRYGWDVQNLDDDDEWFNVWSPWLCESFERSFYSGVHVLYVEARDRSGTLTRARIEIEIIPFRMDRDLLWVDDWLLGNIMPNRMLPSESEHDEFWTGICSKSPGFDPVLDIFPADELYNALEDGPLPMAVLSRYKHVIWTYSNSVENVWKNTIRFQPFPGGFGPNTLALYLAGGGSVLTCGRGDLNDSALGATFPQSPSMPASILDEYLSNGPEGDHPGRFSMAWDDYYITVVDKVIGHFKVGEDFPDGFTRHPDSDAMRSAYYHSGVVGDLPETLDLWDEITQPGMFFDPMVRGFFYVEVYDPAYYMDFLGLSSHDCFSPLYHMRSRSTRSPLDHAAIALVATRPMCEDLGRVGHESYHFGLPLWFIDHGQVEQIMDYVFDRWNIR